MKRLHVLHAALAFAALSAWGAARAETYVVDPGRSFLSWSGRAVVTASGSGSVSAALGAIPFGFSVSGAAPFVAQGPGSLATPLAGSINATVAAGALQVASADIAAQPSGDWRPDAGGNVSASAPADLGAQAALAPQLAFTGGPLVESLAGALAGFLEPSLQGTVYAAARDLRIGMVPVTVALTGGAFPLDAVVAELLAGVVHGAYLTPAVSPWGTAALAGLSGPLGSAGAAGLWSESGGVRSLDIGFTLPEQVASVSLAGQSFGGTGGGLQVAALVESGDVTVHYALSGRLVASTELTAPIPEPSTYALLVAGLVSLAWTARRRSFTHTRYESC